MLKKRILASSMASVMALSSFSVVAFADDATDKKGEAVTAKELQAYVDSFETFITDDLPNYGSKQGEKFQAAIDHAKAVLGEEAPTDIEINAAYQMVKAVESKLAVYTKAQLQDLIKDNQSKYDKNNLLNEEIQDLIYTEDSFAKFTSAFDDATNYVDSGDSRLITDAYVGLSDAVNGLSELKKVSKAQFRTALREYEELELEMKKYESWRRGKLGTVPSTGTAKDKSKLKNANMSMEELIALVYGNLEKISYWDKTKWSTKKAKTVSSDDEADHKDEGRFIGSFEIGKDEALKTYINDKYDQFDNVKGATVTTDKAINAAYEAAQDAVTVFKSWEPDGYKSGSKSSCANIEKKYHSQLVMTFNMDDVETLIDTLEAWTKAEYSGDVSDKKDDPAGLKVTLDLEKHTLKSNKSFAIVKNKKTGLIRDIADVYVNRTAAKAAISDEDKEDYVEQAISAGTNILTYLDYSVAANIGAMQSDYTTAAGAVSNVKALSDVNWSVTAKAASKLETVKGVFNDTTVYKFVEVEAATGYTSDAGTKAIVSGHNTWVGEMETLYKTVKTKREAIYKADATSGDISGAAKDYTDAKTAFENAAKALENGGSLPSTANGTKSFTPVAMTINKDDGTTAYLTLTATAIKNYAANDFDTDGSGTDATEAQLKTVNDLYDKLETKYKALEKAWYEYKADKTVDGKTTESAITKFTKALVDSRIVDSTSDTTYGETKAGTTSAKFVIDDADYLVAKKDYTGAADATYFTLKVKSGVTGDDKKAAQAVVDAHNKEVKRLKNRYTMLKNMVDNQKSVSALTKLVAADEDYIAYNGYDFKNEDDCAAALEIMDRIANGKTIPSAKGSTAEWTLIWRQLAYALEDSFPEATTTKYTLKDLEDMIERAYTAADGTGDSSLFATIHQPLVDQRQQAIEWLKEAKSVTGYKTDDVVAGSTLAAEYDALKGKVEDLEKWLKDFQYSYEEIRDTIGNVAKDIDDGTIKVTAELKKALEDCAYDLSVLEATDVFDEGDAVNPAFDDSRAFQYANRLKTGDSKTTFEPNEFEKNLKKTYDALTKAYEAAKNPAKPAVPGDTDNDGKITMNDVNEILQAVLDGKSGDLKFDANNDNAVNFEDVNFALDVVLKAMG